MLPPDISKTRQLAKIKKVAALISAPQSLPRDQCSSLANMKACSPSGGRAAAAAAPDERKMRASKSLMTCVEVKLEKSSRFMCHYAPLEQSSHFICHQRQTLNNSLI